MEKDVYIFFKSAKTDEFNDTMVVNIDGVKNGVIKAGEELKIKLKEGKHTIEIYMDYKKRCYAKKELNISKDETYLTYAPPLIFAMKGKIAEVTRDRYKEKRKNDKLYGILALIAAIIFYFILKLLH